MASCLISIGPGTWRQRGVKEAVDEWCCQWNQLPADRKPEERTRGTGESDSRVPAGEPAIVRPGQGPSEEGQGHRGEDVHRKPETADRAHKHKV